MQVPIFFNLQVLVNAAPGAILQIQAKIACGDVLAYGEAERGCGAVDEVGWKHEALGVRLVGPAKVRSSLRPLVLKEFFRRCVLFRQVKAIILFRGDQLQTDIQETYHLQSAVLARHGANLVLGRRVVDIQPFRAEHGDLKNDSLDCFLGQALKMF